MKALVYTGPETLELRDVDEPRPAVGEALVAVEAVGICGTDLHIYNWDAWAQSTIKVPTTIGHEFVGEIVDIGSNVNDFKVGDIVSGEGHLVCGRCRNCMAGRRYLCANTRGIGVNTNGGFAEYIAMPMTNIWRHKEGTDMEVAAIFDPFGNAVHTALAFEVFGEDVLITGAGPIGIMAAAVARHAGARHIVITDVNPYRLELAEKLGHISMAVNVKERSLKDVQEELGMKGGFDVGFEMSGVPAAFTAMLSNMFHGGRIALLGIPTEQFPIDWKTVVFNMLTISGIYGRKMYETWYQMSVLLETGVDISPVITHRYSYQDFEKGFEAIRSGDCGKVILDFEEI